MLQRTLLARASLRAAFFRRGEIDDAKCPIVQHPKHANKTHLSMCIPVLAKVIFYEDAVESSELVCFKGCAVRGVSKMSKVYGKERRTPRYRCPGRARSKAVRGAPRVRTELSFTSKGVHSDGCRASRTHHSASPPASQAVAQWLRRRGPFAATASTMSSRATVWTPVTNVQRKSPSTTSCQQRANGWNGDNRTRGACADE
eukprot:6183115-Pleurochrysis_carterae.AAC.2